MNNNNNSNNNNESDSNNKNENENGNQNVNVNENENENEDENNKNENENENENVNVNENENENESKNENENENEKKSDYEKYYLEQINNNFKKIDETKPFKDQTDILKEIPDLGDYWYMDYYEDNKERNLRIFKVKFGHIFNYVDDNLFKEIFGFKSVELVDKLINTTSKEDNQMLIDHIEIKRDKMFEQDKYSKPVIQPPHNLNDLLDTVKVILEFNKTI